MAARQRHAGGLADGRHERPVRPAGSLPIRGASWHIEDAGDFNGDGKADILWQNDNGTPAVWLMNGTSILSTGPGLTNPGLGWHVI